MVGIRCAISVIKCPVQPVPFRFSPIIRHSLENFLLVSCGTVGETEISRRLRRLAHLRTPSEAKTKTDGPVYNRPHQGHSRGSDGEWSGRASRSCADVFLPISQLRRMTAHFHILFVAKGRERLSRCRKTQRTCDVGHKCVAEQHGLTAASRRRSAVESVEPVTW